MQEMVYLYDSSFEGFLSCVFESYAKHEILTAIISGEDFVPMLFATRQVETDPDHAGRVLRKLHRISPDAVDLLRRGFLTCMEDREMALYRLIARLLKEGASLLRRPTDDTLYPVLKAIRHLNGEAHLLKGFVRFSEYSGILAAEIEPKNHVLPLLRSHFCSRYQNERFLIYDRTHREILLYAEGRAIIRALDRMELSVPDESEAAYRRLWKQFYDTIAIKERYNPRCRQTHMPKRYWNTMTEFQGEDYFRAAAPSAGAPAPSAPDGIPAPGTLPAHGPFAPASAP